MEYHKQKMDLLIFEQHIIKLAETQAKPNFTQLQLALMGMDAPRYYYTQLMHVMDRRFNLTPVIEESNTDMQKSMNVIKRNVPL